MHKSAAALAAILLLTAPAAHAQTYTLAPPPYQTVLSTAGAIVPNGCVWTYSAGTTTPIATYSDTSGTVNGNPIVVDNYGRFVAYLLPGTNYKFTYETTPCSAPSTHGTVLKTQDNIQGVPASASNVDIVGTAGEAITAGQCVYLSDGSGGKTQGQWYKCDAANPYSATLPIVGFAPSGISSATTGTIRIAGYLTGLSSLTIGAPYYVSSSAGSITATAPTTNPRRVGVADTTTSLVVLPNPRTAPEGITTCDGRLTLTTGTPVTSADVTAATTLYFSPYKGNRCALYDGTAWTIRTFAEVSIAVPATTSQLYDVWLYDNAGTIALELLAWTNDTTRATALTTQDGVYVKTGATTRRYLGSVRTTTVSGQTEDSAAKRYVWNYYNRLRRAMRVVEATDTWTYTTGTYRQANGSTANQLDVVVGVAEALIEVEVKAAANNTNTAVFMIIAIGEDSTSAKAAECVNGFMSTQAAAGINNATAALRKYPAVGRHFYAWLELSNAIGTTTWYGDNGGTQVQTGITGSIEG